VRRDERGAGLCGRSHRLRDPAVDGDELSEPEGNDVGRLGGVVPFRHLARRARRIAGRMADELEFTDDVAALAQRMDMAVDAAQRFARRAPWRHQLKMDR
jgi:hypothetical protein